MFMPAIMKISAWIVILLMPFIIMAGNFYLYLYNENFYSEQFRENNVNVKDKEIILNNLFNFFKNKEDCFFF